MQPDALLVPAIAAVFTGAPPPAYVAAVTIGAVELAIGVGAVTSVALLATLLVIAARWRRSVQAGNSDDRPPAAPATNEERVTAALHRRTLRRARVRIDEDPIVASIRVGSTTRAERPERPTRRAPRRPPPR
jgi:membrane protein implicated in regulation of membrane protease activity